MSTLAAILLAGGQGRRLASVSNGAAKGLITINAEGTVSGLEHIRRIFTALDIKDVTLTMHPGDERYNHFIEDTSYRALYHGKEVGNGGAVREAFEQLGLDRQYLVLAPDTYVSAPDIAKLIKAHLPGTLTWGVAPRNPTLNMDSYGGLVVDAQNRILGDITQSPWQGRELQGCTLFIKGAVQIIDPRLFLDGMREYRRLHEATQALDLYWDVMPFIEEQNRQRVLQGTASFMNAVVFEDDLIDFGTPERLALTRERYNSASAQLRRL